MVALLLAHSVDPFQKDAAGMCALHHALNSNGTGDLDTVKVIVQAMLKAPFKENRMPWSVAMNGGSTPLQFAEWHGQSLGSQR